MNHVPTRNANLTGPSLTTEQFLRIARLAQTGWGLKLDDAKRPLIETRLGRRLGASGATGYDDYCDLIAAGDAEECEHFVNALTTNVTQFYRELHHFNTLEKEILPKLVERARANNPIRIWSAGCSSGQEPYSIAGSIMSSAPELVRRDVKILATDIDLAVLKKAEAGVYDVKECGVPTPAHALRLFRTSHKDKNRPAEVRQEIRALVTFRRLNLTQSWPIGGEFDVIFCRNVAIYFDKPTQAELWAAFSRHLRPGGTLFIGHSERIHDPEQIGLSTAGVTTYRRKADFPDVVS